MSFYLLWAKRSLFSLRTVFQFSALFSLFGLLLSVACLTLVILVVEGFSSALENSLISRQGHIRVLADKPIPKKHILQDIAPYQNKILRQIPFAGFEGLIVKGDRFKGGLFESLEDKSLKSSSFLKNRLLKGGLKTAVLPRLPADKSKGRKERRKAPRSSGALFRDSSQRSSPPPPPLRRDEYEPPEYPTSEIRRESS